MRHGFSAAIGRYQKHDSLARGMFLSWILQFSMIAARDGLDRQHVAIHPEAYDDASGGR